MELQSKLLLACFLVFVAILSVINYFDKMTVHDFTVFDYVTCDPSDSVCFVYCEEECAYDEPYAKIEKSGRSVTVCNPITDDCEELSCLPEESNCLITYCSEDELEPGEVCYEDSMSEEVLEI